MFYFRITFLIWNLIVFLIYGFDKFKSIKKYNRTSELTLIFCALLLGGLGATVGMLVFNHKTKKTKFRIFVPLSLFIWLYISFYVL